MSAQNFILLCANEFYCYKVSGHLQGREKVRFNETMIPFYKVNMLNTNRKVIIKLINIG